MMTTAASPRDRASRSLDESGFTLVELMIASMITLVIMGVAFTTFQNALDLNEGAADVADAGQNLRAGTNLLIRDLTIAGRNIPVGGINIPNGDGAEAVKRPGPSTMQLTFGDPDETTTLKAITTGNGRGAEIAGQETDIITIVMDDPFRPDELNLNSAVTEGEQTYPMLAADGSYIDVGEDGEDCVGTLATCPSLWLAGILEDGISPITEGDLIYFSNAHGSTLQQVTDVDGSIIRFEEDDDFNLNQPDAEGGSITEIAAFSPTIRRVLMFTYFVEAHEGAPRLMRRLNFYPAEALAGSVEDLQFTYDLVDGEFNPVGVEDLPYEVNDDTTLTATQIRKVNLEVGVRSEDLSTAQKEYIRQHVSTVISIRNLAFVTRYDNDE